MIKVTTGNNVNRQTVIVEETLTLRDFLEKHEVDYTVGTMSLDGCSLKAGDLDKTFEEMGVTERCFLISIAKADNA